MMGNTEVRVHPKRDFPQRELFDTDDINGYVLFSNLEVNDDVLCLILSHLDPQNLLNCRQVCKNWANLIDTEVWRLKLFAAGLGDNSRIRSLPWHYLYMILGKSFLNRNLVKNPHGRDNLKHWKILSNGGSHWKKESPPEGTDLPDPHDSCFATSFHSCSKEQVIDLGKIGAMSCFMDEVQPDIVVSEWYAGRWDCRAVYEMEVNLLKESGEVAKEVNFRERCGGELGSKWQQVSHTFRNYGEGVRYIRFYHGGVDEQFWAGHYGSKMTGAEVRLVIPETTDQTN